MAFVTQSQKPKGVGSSRIYAEHLHNPKLKVTFMSNQELQFATKISQ